MSRIKITSSDAKALIDAIAIEAEQVGLTDLALMLKKWGDGPRAAVDLAGIIRESIMSMDAARRGKA